MTIVPYVAHSEGWHALRIKHVGASEIAALWDVQPAHKLSRWALWQIKAGRAEPPVVNGERVAWGNRLEPIIAEFIADTEGWTIRKGGYAEDDTCPGLGASLDYEIERSSELAAAGYEGDGILEIKAIDWLSHKAHWTEGEPPLHILLQLQAQLAASGYLWGAIGALVSGNESQVHLYHARPKLIQEIRRRVHAFWQSIRDGEEPAIDGSDGANSIVRALYPVLEDDSIDMETSNEWAEAAQDLFNAAAAQRAAREAYDQARNRVALLLDGHRAGYGNGWRVNCAVTPENPGRLPRVGELVGKRAEVRRYTAREMT